MTKKVEETAVVEVKQQAVVAQPHMPSVAGFEGVDMERISMPRVKVMQGLSPELADEDYNFRQGDIIHALLMEKVPEKFIPVKFWDSRILFVPRNDEKQAILFERVRELFGADVSDVGIIICRADDSKTGNRFGNCKECPLGQWHEDEPPLCTQTMNALALFEGQDMPVVVPFANTSYKYGRKFVEMALFSGGASYTRKYKLVSKREQNEKGVFFTMQAKPAGLPTDEEKALAMAMYQQFSGRVIETELDDQSEEQQTLDF